MTITTPATAHDPVTLEVIRMRLDSIVEEMGIAMIRSSGSPVITEAGDFNTALFTPDGRIYSYSDYVQFHIGSGGVAVRNLVATIGDEQLQPGDAFICNDPHTSGSSHPPDTTVISPIFHGGKLIAWAQSQAHLVDVGGMTPGGFAPAALDCYSEAVRIPPGVKVFEAGVPVESTKRLLLNNVRVPVLYWNDVRSLVASNNTGITRLPRRSTSSATRSSIATPNSASSSPSTWSVSGWRSYPTARGKPTSGPNTTDTRTVSTEFTAPSPSPVTPSRSTSPTRAIRPAGSSIVRTAHYSVASPAP